MSLIDELIFLELSIIAVVLVSDKINITNCPFPPFPVEIAILSSLETVIFDKLLDTLFDKLILQSVLLESLILPFYIVK